MVIVHILIRIVLYSNSTASVNTGSVQPIVILGGNVSQSSEMVDRQANNLVLRFRHLNPTPQHMQELAIKVDLSQVSCLCVFLTASLNSPTVFPNYCFERWSALHSKQYRLMISCQFANTPNIAKNAINTRFLRYF